MTWADREAVASMTTFAIEAAARRAAEAEATREPGIGTSVPVHEGVAWRAMQQERLAALMAEVHQAH